MNYEKNEIEQINRYFLALFKQNNDLELFGTGINTYSIDKELEQKIMDGAYISKKEFWKEMYNQIEIYFNLCKEQKKEIKDIDKQWLIKIKNEIMNTKKRIDYYKESKKYILNYDFLTRLMYLMFLNRYFSKNKDLNDFSFNGFDNLDDFNMILYVVYLSIIRYSFKEKINNGHT